MKAQWLAVHRRWTPVKALWFAVLGLWAPVLKMLWLAVLGLWTPALEAQPAVGLLETLRSLTLEQHPEWTDSELDSAYAAWTQWTVVGAPREAGALSFIAPPQQFKLEIYQSQFGWPRDSTEWRAIPLTATQREALQTLYHGVRAAPAGRILRGPIDPSLNLGWSCSGCSPFNAHRGTRLGLTSSAASANAQPWASPTWTLRSPSDYPVRVWAGPRSVAVGIRPAMLPRHGPRGLGSVGMFGAAGASGAAGTDGAYGANGANERLGSSKSVALLRRFVDQAVLGRDSSGVWFGDLSLRSAYVGVKAGVSSRGWTELSATWYGPGGLLVAVQREWVPAEPGSGDEARPGTGERPGAGDRPGAGATPWRPLRGNRASAALPLWAGRLTIQSTTTGPSAAWADRRRSVVWYPGQLNLGIRSKHDPWTPRSAISLRSHLYLGRAQGASVQLRWPSGPFTTELGIAGITISESQPNVLERLLDGNLSFASIKNPDSISPQTNATVLPRATGPMTLWRPGWTAEAALTYTTNLTRINARIRRSPSGWSGSIRAQLPLQNW